VGSSNDPERVLGTLLITDPKIKRNYGKATLQEAAEQGILST
jgi:hypothetical protein